MLLEKIKTSNSKITSIEDFLQKIIAEIQVPESQYALAISRFTAIENWLSRGESILKGYNPKIKMQGSFRIGTAIKPISLDDNYDIDLNCTTTHSKTEYSQKDFKNIIGDELKGYIKANNMKNPLDEKRRCWRLEYAGDTNFHMDIVPAIKGNTKKQNKLIYEREIRQDFILNNILSITDNETKNYNLIDDDWESSNPEGYAIWFQQKMGNIFKNKRRILAERSNSLEADIADYNVKTPLQAVIQLLKWHRDITLDINDKNKPISIIITTLATHAYNQEETITDALSGIINKMANFIEVIDSNTYRIENPTDPDENFADKWHDEPEKREAFYVWLDAVKQDFSELLKQENLDSIIENHSHYLSKKLIQRVLPTEQKQLIECIVNPNHKQNISSQGWNEAFNPNISVKIKAKKQQFFFWNDIFSDNGRLSKDDKLQFTADVSGISSNDKIYWQITNTGSVARGLRCLRGDFYPSNNGVFTRKESALYRGTHTVQCFIIKNNTCIAKSGLFIIHIQ